ncbi:Ldh family oxidoreductase [Ralstonia syzygii]|uniref:Ldh family oxidoreductase n=1 Tax=Ralstonia syzygii TaxID=28097 RepID=UPI0036F28E29
MASFAAVNFNASFVTIMSATVTLSLGAAHDLAYDVLSRNGVAPAHAAAVAKSVVAGQRDECYSHGMYRLIVCVRSLRAGKVAGDAVPIVRSLTPALTRVDAQFGFAQVAFEIRSSGKAHGCRRSAGSPPECAAKCGDQS